MTGVNLVQRCGVLQGDQVTAEVAQGWQFDRRGGSVHAMEWPRGNPPGSQGVAQVWARVV